jgi:cytidylate kinase
MLIVTGPPGAGKSTVSALVAARFERSVLLRGDDFFHFIHRGYVAPWHADSQQQNEVVIDATAAAAARYCAGGYVVVVDAVVGPWFLDRWCAQVPEATAVHYVILQPNKEVAAARALGRVGRHDLVDAEPVALMHDAFASRGGRHANVIDSSWHTPEHTASEVAAQADAGLLFLAR